MNNSTNHNMTDRWNSNSTENTSQPIVYDRLTPSPSLLECGGSFHNHVLTLTVNFGTLGLIGLGILGNVICIVLMVTSSSNFDFARPFKLFGRRRARRPTTTRFRRPFNLNLFTAYTCDVSFLVCVLVQFVRQQGTILMPWILCHHLAYVSHVLSFVSQWCLWAASTQRYLALARPLKYAAPRQLNDGGSNAGCCCRIKLKDTAIVMAIFLLAFVTESWIPLTFGTDPSEPGKCTLVPNGTLPVEWVPVFNGVEAAFSYILPGFMIFACTIGVRRVLRRYNPTSNNSRVGSTQDRAQQLRRVSLSDLVEASRTASGGQQKNREDEKKSNGGGSGGGSGGYVIVSATRRRKQEKRERRIVLILLLISVADASLNIQNYLVRNLVWMTSFETFLRSVDGCLVWSVLYTISRLLYYCQFLLNVIYWLAFPYARGAIGSTSLMAGNSKTREDANNNSSSNNGKVHIGKRRKSKSELALLTFSVATASGTVESGGDTSDRKCSKQQSF